MISSRPNRRNALGVQVRPIQAPSKPGQNLHSQEEANRLRRFDTNENSIKKAGRLQVNNFDKLPNYCKKFKKIGQKILDHPFTNFSFIVFTIWALFADDIKMMTTSNESDVGFSISVIFIQFIFSLEVLVGSFCVDNYFLGFFFWLDVISIVSLFLNIHWVNDIIIENLSGTSDQSTTGNKSNSKTVKVGTKAVTVLRIVRLIRIVRITKIFKISENLTGRTVGKFKIELEKEEEQLVEKLNIGKKLSDSTMRRVIILMLSMIMGIIVLDPNFYFQAVSSNEFAFKMLNDFKSINDPGLIIAVDQLIKTHENTITEVLYLQILNYTYGDPDSGSSLRESEKIQLDQDCSGLIADEPPSELFLQYMNYSSSLDGNTRCYILYDNIQISQLNALISICKTIAVCMILIFGAFCFSKDTNSMVLMPLDSMVRKIQRLTKNPAKGKQENELEEYFNLLKRIEKRRRVGCCKSDAFDGNRNIETIILDKTIMKIGSLMAMGYGEAGSMIIEKNLQENQGEVNPMSPGEKLIGIFAHLNIVKSEQLSKAIGDKYTILLNEVLRIVNEVTSNFNIYNLKSTGDGILLVWKLDDEYSRLDSNGNLYVADSVEIREIVDMTLICLLKIETAIQTSQSLAKLRENPQVKENLTNYNLNVSIGLNIGWAIEGVIGSSFKIDISYFSPVINYAQTLESLTKHYDSNLIFSQDFMNLMTDDSKIFCRPIDSIMNKNKAEKIYTIDMDLTCLTKDMEDEFEGRPMKITDKVLLYEQKELKKRLYMEKIHKGSCWNDYVDSDFDFGNARQKYTYEYFEEFKSALEDYISGDWESALNKLEMLDITFSLVDPVANYLTNLIKEWDRQSPANWKGGRMIMHKK